MDADGTDRAAERRDPLPSPERTAVSWPPVVSHWRALLPIPAAPGDHFLTLWATWPGPLRDPDDTAAVRPLHRAAWTFAMHRGSPSPEHGRRGEVSGRKPASEVASPLSRRGGRGGRG